MKKIAGGAGTEDPLTLALAVRVSLSYHPFSDFRYGTSFCSAERALSDGAYVIVLFAKSPI